MMKKIGQLHRGNKGFTLVELMIVVAIIGILAAIAIPQFVMYRQKAYDAAANSALQNCKTAAESYFIENRSYPTQPGQFECQTDDNIGLYYLPLGPEEYQIISFHREGQKAFLSHSSSNTIEENTRVEIEQQLRDNFGADTTQRSFYFLQ